MRVKTDSRRQAILKAAWAVFSEHGLQGATMSEISARVGGSKATLYGYFKSKDELFIAALQSVVRESVEVSYELLTGEGNLRQRLIGFALNYLTTRLDPALVAMDRTMIAVADQSDVVRRLREEFFEPNWRRTADVLEREMAAGRLRRSDPYRAGAQLRSLIGADLLDRRLHGETGINRQDIETEVVEGVDTFLRAYAPDS